MLIAAHTVIYSKNAAADRVFMRDVLKLQSVDAGGGFLIFAAPAAEIGVHEADANDRHELYFLCEDVRAFVTEMRRRDVACAEIADRGWGLLTEVTLPGGGKIGVYEPRHARPSTTKGRKDA